MKKEIEVYSCDYCKKNKEQMKAAGYPHQDGWCRIIQVGIDVAKEKAHSLVNNYETLLISESDFCSVRCLKKFFEVKVDSAMKVDVDKVIKEQIDERNGRSSLPMPHKPRENRYIEDEKQVYESSESQESYYDDIERRADIAANRMQDAIERENAQKGRVSDLPRW